jgi:uncharacterized membrane protein
VRVPPRGVSPKALSRLVFALGILTLVAILVLRPTGKGRPDAPGLTTFKGTYTASVERLADQPCAGAEGAAPRCVSASFRLLDGPDAGGVTTIELSPRAPRTASLGIGDRVVLGHQPQVPGFEYVFLDRDRRSSLVVLAGIFVIAVLALGRWRGLSSLVGLAATLAVVFAFVVPSILEGRDPLAVSVAGAVTIAFAALYLSHGFNTRTTVALVGTLGGLIVAAALAMLFMGAAQITGLATEEALVLAAVGSDLDLRGLILGGMMIGALGAIDDMTVTQVSAVWELRDVDPTVSPRRLTRAGLRIGRDHVASTVNTLVLAYAGASMPLLVLFVLSDQPAGIVANGEIVATEIVRTLVGSIGLVASVPIATILAAHVAQRRTEIAAPSTPAAHQPRSRPFRGVGPEEQPIPDRRRDVWFRRLRAGRHRDSA